MNKTRNLLLTSAAAVALMAGVGLALAQAPAPAAPTPAPAAQTSAPAEKMAPAPAAKGKTPVSTMKSGQADDKMDRKGTRAQRTQDNAAPDSSKGARSGDTNVEPKSRETSREKSQDKSRAGMSGESRTKSDARRPESASGRTGNAKIESKSQTTVGGSESLSGEQRSTIRTVITRQNVKPMANVNFAISVGTMVPRTTHFNRVPMELVQIYPHWRGYDYVLVGDQILVINPRTHKIVAILDA